MISAINNCQPSFTSVIPIKVIENGMETFDEKTIRNACRQLTNIMIGPAHGNRRNENIVRRIAAIDPDYRLLHGLEGHPKLKGQKKARPSDYFKVIYDNILGCFILTGEHAKILQNAGRNIGLEKGACKEREISESLDLLVAKDNYKQTVKRIIENPRIRVREEIAQTYPTRRGQFVTLILNMINNNKKTTLENIGLERSLYY